MSKAQFILWIILAIYGLAFDYYTHFYLSYIEGIRMLWYIDCLQHIWNGAESQRQESYVRKMQSIPLIWKVWPANAVQRILFKYMAD